MFYDSNDLYRLNAKRRAHIIAVVAVGVAAIVACVLLCVFADHENGTIMTVIAAVTLVLGGWFVIGDVFIVIRPCKHRIIHIGTALEQDKSTARGIVKSITHITVSKYMSAYEITLDEDGGILRYLWDDEVEMPQIELGDVVRFTTVGRYIVDCEAQNGN